MKIATFTPRLLAVVVSLLALAVVLVGCRGSRKGHESAPYQVVSSDGKFELRDYPPVLVAETPMRGDSGSSFQRLFRYISGQNEESKKIAMTTPVFMSGNEPARSMSFVMPVDMQSAPLPKDSLVRVATMPAGRFAVFGFSGSRSGQAEKNALEQLRAWLKTQDLIASGEPIYGYFDPPWTPSFLRRNEVMLRVGMHESTQ